MKRLENYRCATWQHCTNVPGIPTLFIYLFFRSRERMWYIQYISYLSQGQREMGLNPFPSLSMWYSSLFLWSREEKPSFGMPPSNSGAWISHYHASLFFLPQNPCSQFWIFWTSKEDWFAFLGDCVCFFLVFSPAQSCFVLDIDFPLPRAVCCIHFS